MRLRGMPVVLSLIFALGVRDITAQSCSGTTTVTTAPSGCATWTGDIIIPTATGSNGPDELNLDGLEEIQGNLNVTEQNHLVTLSSDSLHTVTEQISLENLQILNTVDLPELTEASDLVLIGLPSLQQTSLLESLQTLSSLQIINSASGSLRGFNLETIRDVRIINNPFLQEITLQPYNITGNISIAANGRDLKLSMPNLEIARSVTLSNCTSISIPSLRMAYDVTVFGNSIDELDGMPLLNRVDGSLRIVNNWNMSRIALPGLQQIGGDLLIQNNTELRLMDELYTLEGVGGDIELEGPFDGMLFPNLADIRGAFELNSTGSMQCSDLDTWRASNIKGPFSCHSAVGANSTHAGVEKTAEDETSGASTSAGENGPNDGSSDDDQDTGLSIGARIGIGIGVGGGVGAIVGGIIGYLFDLRNKRRKAKQQDDDDPSSPSGDLSGKPEMDGSGVEKGVLIGNDGQKFELDSPHTVGEMGVGNEAQELPSKHGASELDDRDAKGWRGQPEGLDRTHEMPGDSSLAGDRKDKQ